MVCNIDFSQTKWTNISYLNLLQVAVQVLVEHGQQLLLVFILLRTLVVATTARSDFALYVGGDQYVDGNVTIGGTLRTENKINVDSIGIVTARTQINVGYDYESGPGVGVTILSSGNADYAGIVTASTVKASTAFYPPLYTTAARDAGTFTQGAIIFNTTSSKLEFYDGTSWQSLPGMSLGLTVALRRMIILYKYLYELSLMMAKERTLPFGTILLLH